MARFNAKYTITAGTPINIGTGTTASDGLSRWASRVYIEMGTGGAGIGYVMAGILGTRVPSTANSSDVTAELFAASSTGPGGYYGDVDPNYQAGGIDVTTIWIDGANSGDPVRVSFELK